MTESELEIVRSTILSHANDVPVLAPYGPDPIGNTSSEIEFLFRRLGLASALEPVHSSLQLGFFTQRAVAKLGIPRARARLATLRQGLKDSLGETGDLVADAILAYVDRLEGEVRGRARQVIARRTEGESGGFSAAAASGAEELAATRRALKRFVDRLKGAESVRRKHSKRGRIDLARTIRRSRKAFDVPFRLVRKAKPRSKSDLLLLCDVSDSVRDVARFLLEFSFLAQTLFSKTRTFVFVGGLGETTEAFKRMPLDAAIARAFSGTVDMSRNSNYERALVGLERDHPRALTKRTTVLILGDGRTNYQGDGVAALMRIRERVRAVVWLCPEPMAEWAKGDSAMRRYAQASTHVFEVKSVEDLEVAARKLVHIR